MATEAQRQGIVKGKRYRVAGPREGGCGNINAGGGCVKGSIVELSNDDGTSLPFFNRLNLDGSIAYKGCCINIIDTQLEEVTEATDLSYRIESNKDETNVYVRKQLSLDQIKRIMDILGE